MILRHRVERLPPGTWKKVHAKRTGPFRVKTKVSANAYRLHLPSYMGIGPVFNVADLTPYYGPSDEYILYSTYYPSTNHVEPILVPILLVPPTPLMFSHYTT